MDAIMASSTFFLLVVMAAVVSHARWVPPKLEMGPRSEHACLLTHVGEVKCWGRNYRGQLGIPADTEAIGGAADFDGNGLQPVDLGTDHYAVAVATGDAHTCAVLDNGKAKCWGDNRNGQLGYGDELHHGMEAGQMGDNLPFIELGSDSPVVNIWGGGYHTCALLESHELKCWGRNNEGQLGFPTSPQDDWGVFPGHMGISLPSVNLGVSPDGPFVSDMALGRQHTCALLTDGSMKCWGYNGMGELGYGDDIDRGGTAGTMGAALPLIDLGTGRIATRISAGQRHTCALLDNQAVKCWGNNAQGQTGRAMTNSNNYGDDPNEMGNNIRSVNFGSGVKPVDIKSGEYHTCAVLDDASLKCWGGNYQGNLGYGDTDHRGREAAELGSGLPRVDLGENAQVLHVGCAKHTCVVCTDGQVKCFGANRDGMLGIGSDKFEEKSDEEKEKWGDGPDEMGANLPTVLTMVLTSTTTGTTDTATTTLTTTTLTDTATTATVTTTTATDTATLTTVVQAGFIDSARSPGGGLVAPLVLAALAVWAWL